MQDRKTISPALWRCPETKDRSESRLSPSRLQEDVQKWHGSGLPDCYHLPQGLGVRAEPAELAGNGVRLALAGFCGGGLVLCLR